MSERFHTLRETIDDLHRIDDSWPPMRGDRKVVRDAIDWLEAYEAQRKAQLGVDDGGERGATFAAGDVIEAETEFMQTDLMSGVDERHERTREMHRDELDPYERDRERYSR